MLQRFAQERMTELASSMNSGTTVSEKLEYLVSELAVRLRSTKGKKVYGYLPPQVKRVVDEIVDELAKDERVAAAYSLWQDMQDEVVRTYTDEMPVRVPLSQQEEFKPVRNMVIREVLKLTEGKIFDDDEDMDDEPEDEPVEPPPSHRRDIDYEQTERYRRAKKHLYDEYASADEKREAIAELEKLWDEGCTVAAHQLGKAYRDGLGVDADAEKAVEWFRRSAERGTICSAYCLGKLLLTTGASDEAIRWLKYAADGGDQFTRYVLGKIYLTGEHVPKDADAAVDYLKLSAVHGNQYAQYALGRLCLLGQDVPLDREQAVDYLTRSASQGNKYAQYFLDHLNDTRSPSVGLAVLQMFRHMANIFRDSAATASGGANYRKSASPWAASRMAIMRCHAKESGGKFPHRFGGLKSCARPGVWLRRWV